MATRVLLADLAGEIGRAHGIDVSFESAGGVDVARRIREGAGADIAVLAEDAIAKLVNDGFAVPGTARPLFLSEVVAAVRAGTPRPAFESEDDLATALRSAGAIAYSTGPSGKAVVSLIQRWGLFEDLESRLVQAPPGVPVGTFLADGNADLAFQQLSEMRGVPGVWILGPLPGDAAITSVFGGAVLTASTQPELAADVLRLLGSEQSAELVESRGMRLAR